MKNIIVVSLVCILVVSFISISSVSASGEYQSPTPTHNYLTPPFTPTPFTNEVSEFDFSCPAGLPSGYGETVPDPSWLASCSHCLPTPTVFPTYDFDAPLENSISCGLGSCVQVDADTIYFLGAPSSHFITEWFFGLAADADLYVYVRYAGYTVQNQVGDVVDLDNVRVGLGVTGEGGELSVSYVYNDIPVLPDMTVETASGVAAGGHSLVHSLIEGVTFGSGDNFNPSYLTQSFGCTRLYVSTVEFSDWDSFTCPLSIDVPGTGCVEPTPVSDEEISCNFADDGNWSCEEIDSNTVELHRISNQQNNYGFEIVDLPEDANLYVDWITSGNVHMDLGYCSTIDLLIEFAGQELDTYNSGSCLIDWDVNEHHQSVIFVEADDTVDIRDACDDTPDNICYVNASMVVTISSSGFPFECEGGGGTATAFPVNSPITGSVCDAVIPYDLVPNFDFTLFTSSPSICTVVPGWSALAILPDWLEVFVALSEDLADFLSNWGVFPASTICYHYVTFQDQYILNVSISLSLMAWTVLALWALRKFTAS